MQRIRKSGKRRGAAVVEMAAVAIVFTLLLFGILEYCRFIFVRQIVTNAGREGARYAAVNVNDSTVTTDTQNYVATKMVNMQSKTGFYQCQVYQADSAGTNIGAAGNAGFGTYVAVQIDYDYNPILPQFLFMGNTIRITTKTMMYSEAN